MNAFQWMAPGNTQRRPEAHALFYLVTWREQLALIFQD